jgi:hypothetical protein
VQVAASNIVKSELDVRNLCETAQHLPVCSIWAASDGHGFSGAIGERGRYRNELSFESQGGIQVSRQDIQSLGAAVIFVFLKSKPTKVISLK